MLKQTLFTKETIRRSLSRYLKAVLFGVLVIGVFSAPYTWQSQIAVAETSSTLNFQARLQTSAGSLVPDGSYSIQFRIYNQASAGSHLWQETQNLTVRNGHFSAYLGSAVDFPASIDWSQELWLTMNVNGDGEMNPRIKLTAVPYAFRAKSASQLSVTQGDFTGTLAFDNLTANRTILLPDSDGTVCLTSGNCVGQGYGDILQGGNSFDELMVIGTNDEHGIALKTANEDRLTISATGDIALQGNTEITGSHTFTVGTGATTLGGTLSVVGTSTFSGAATFSGGVIVGADQALRLTGGSTASRPAEPEEGMLFYDTDTKQLLIYNGTRWQNASRGQATVVVAANNSANRDGADFIVPNGAENAQETINSAISSLPADGGIVYLMEGRYTVDGSIELPSNTTLSGAGSSTELFIKPDGGTVNSFDVITNDDHDNGNTAITIRNLAIHGNRSNLSGGTQMGILFNNVGAGSGVGAEYGAKVESVWITHIRNAGIGLNDSRTVTIQDTTVKFSLNAGIVLEDSIYSIISNNTIQGNNGGMRLIGNSYENQIQNNIIQGNSNGTGLLIGSSRNNISNNTIADNGAYGISLTSWYNTVSNNYIRNSGQAGIRIATAGGMLVDGNQMLDNGGTGSGNSIQIEGNSPANRIINNHIYDDQGTGAAISIPSNASGTYLSNNIFNGPGAQSISDSSSSTVYVNQSTGPNGTNIVNKTGNSTRALQVQNASGQAVLNVDTQNGRIGIGTDSPAAALSVGMGSPFQVNDDGAIVAATGIASSGDIIFSGLLNCAVLRTNAHGQLQCGGPEQTQYYYDFEDETIGQLPSYISLPWQNANVEIATSSWSENNRVLRVDPYGSNAFFAAVFNEVPAAKNIEILMRVRDTGSYSATHWLTGAAARVSGGVGTQEGVFGSMRIGATNNLVNAAIENGSFNANYGTSATQHSAREYMRVRWEDNSVWIKAWGGDMDSEPAIWEYGGTTPAAIDAYGLAGIMRYHASPTTELDWIRFTILDTVDSPLHGQGSQGQIGFFDSDGNLTGSNNFFWDADSNSLGLGTDNPQATLDVVGDARFSGQATFNGGVVVGANQALRLTGGTTANRPSSPEEGMIFYDTETKQLLVYNGTTWRNTARTSSTVIVAAPDSKNRDGADFIVPGSSSAETTINAAITSLPSSGGTVQLMEGNYVISGSIELPDNVTLAGAGNGTTLLLESGYNNAINIITNSNTSSGTGITIRDLKIDGNRANQAGSNNQFGIYLNGMGGSSGSNARAGALINNVSILNMNSRGMSLLNSGNNTISNTSIVNSRFYGIMMQNSQHNIIESNSIRGSGTAGVRVHSSSYRNTITGNTIEGNSGDGIQNNASNGNIISDNVIEANGGAGIVVSSSSNSVVVSSNVVIANTLNGIKVEASHNTMVQGNRVGDNGSSPTPGIIVEGNADWSQIISNYITKGGGASPAIQIVSSSADNTYLSQNIFNGNGANGIADNGTNTIFANQALGQNGANVVNKSANSGTAFQVQNASGQAVLNVDTANNSVGLAELAVANNLTVGGTVQIEGATTIAVDSNVVDAFQVQNASGQNVFSVDTVNGQAMLGQAGQSNGRLVVHNSTTSNSVTIQTGATSTSYTLVLPTTAGSAGQCLVNSSTPGVLTWGACGGGGGSQTVMLAPEFPGGTLQADGTDNDGFMTSGHGGGRNYYEWTSTESSAQDYDIVVTTMIPSGYSNGLSNFRISTWRDNNSNASASYSIQKQDGTPCSSGNLSFAGTVSTWSQSTIATPMSCSLDANDVLIIAIKTQASNGAHVRIGAIEYTYN